MPRRLLAAEISQASAQQVDELQSGEMFFVVRGDGTVVGFGDGGDDHVEAAARSHYFCSLGHSASPDQTGFLIEQRNPTAKLRSRAIRAEKPARESSRPTSKAAGGEDAF
jgi:hypothetical protein